jgi:hypothetical protein
MRIDISCHRVTYSLQRIGLKITVSFSSIEVVDLQGSNLESLPCNLRQTSGW